MSLMPFQDRPGLFQKRNLTQPLSIVFPFSGGGGGGTRQISGEGETTMKRWR